MQKAAKWPPSFCAGGNGHPGKLMDQHCPGMRDVILPPPVFLSLLPLLSSATGLLGPFLVLVPLFLWLRPRSLLYDPWLHPLALESWTSLLCWGEVRRGSYQAFFSLLPLHRRRRPLFNLLPRGFHPGGILPLSLDRRRHASISRTLKVLPDCLVARLVTIVLMA